MARRMMPHDKEAEAGLLGGIVMNNHAIFQVRERIQPEYFFSPAHREIYKSMLTLTDAQTIIDEITIKDDLKARGKLGMCGGMYYLAQLQDMTYVSANVLVYAEIVKDKWIARQAIQGGIDLIRSLYETGHLNGQADAFRKKLNDLSMEKEAHKSRQASELLSEFSEWLESDAPFESDAKFHIPALDATVGGITTERPTVIAARPGTGKTALLTQIAVDNAKFGVPVLLFNLEMSERTIAARILAARARMAGDRLIYRKTDEMTDQDWDSMSVAMGELADLPLYLHSPVRPMSIEQMESVVRWHMDNRGVRLVVLDHLYRIKSTAHTIYEQTVERMMGVVEMQRALKVPVLLAVQINREGEREPSLSNLKGGGDIEDNADAVVILHDNDATGNHARKITARIAKNANGKRGDCDLEYLPWCFTIR